MTDTSWRHLAYHLVRAGDNDALYDLIAKPWMERRFEKSFSYWSFAGDVASATAAAGAEDPPNLAQIVRGALVYATLTAVSSNVPPVVLAALARVGDHAKAIGYAGLTQSGPQRFEAYRLIAEELIERGANSEALSTIKRARAAAESIEDVERREEALARVTRAVERAEGQLAGGREPIARLRDAETAADARTRGTIATEMSTAPSWDDAVAKVERVADEQMRADELRRLVQTPTLANSSARVWRLKSLWDNMADIGSQAEVLGAIVHALTGSGEYEEALIAAESMADPTAAHAAIAKFYDAETAGYYAMDIGFATMRLEGRLRSEKARGAPVDCGSARANRSAARPGPSSVRGQHGGLGRHPSAEEGVSCVAQAGPRPRCR
jgi:hypothetical protein